MGGSEIELELQVLSRLMPDKRICNFQIPKTIPTNGLTKSYCYCYTTPPIRGVVRIIENTKLLQAPFIAFEAKNTVSIEKEI